MAKNKSIETLIKADEVTPIAEFHGIQIASYEDCILLTEADIINHELEKDDTAIADRVMNPNGLPARSRTKYAAVNPERMFSNRVRYIMEDGTKKMQIVTDYRAIHEQETGKVYLKRVPCYQLSRQGKKLVVDKMLTVDDTEFIADFADILNLEAMLEVLPAIESAGSDMTAGAIGI